MAPRFSAAIRLLAVLLLALAVSPLTAPFSSAHPGQLFGTTDSLDGPMVGARKVPDEPVAGLDGRTSIVLLGRIDGRPAPRPGTGVPRGLDTRHLPLRI
ncbi:hypothetical protein BH23ACI1_BH23ACI1_17770 [soil metagenome]